MIKFDKMKIISNIKYIRDINNEKFIRVTSDLDDLEFPEDLEEEGEML